jgi:ADP-heptose:LPS heptosyltransferase
MTIDLPNPPQRILLIKPSAIGDVVHTLPVWNLLRRHWPARRSRGS